MARIDQEKLKCFKDWAMLFSVIMKMTNCKISKFEAALDWSSKNIAYVNNEVFIHKQKQAIKLSKSIMTKATKLKSQLNEFAALGDDINLDVEALSAVNENSEKAIKTHTGNIDELFEWAKLNYDIFYNVKRGRKIANEGMKLFCVIELLHIIIFHKKGSLTPDQYFVQTIKECCHLCGINISEDAIKTRIDQYRKFAATHADELAREPPFLIDMLSAFTLETAEKSGILDGLENARLEELAASIAANPYSLEVKNILENPSKIFELFKKIPPA